MRRIPRARRGMGGITGLGRLSAPWVVGVAASAGLAQQTVTVDYPHRDVDIDSFPFTDATIEDLPGPDGRVSFAEALIVSNNTPGRQTIAFAIDPSEFFFQDESPGVAVMFMNPPSFNDVIAPVTIDGTTQTAFTGDTNPDGAEVRIRGARLNITAPDVVVRGLDSSIISLGPGATSCTIEGNTGLFPLTGTGDGAGAIEILGGGELAEHVIRNNEVGSISIDRSSGNEVTGNTARRIEVVGFVGGPEGLAQGNLIGGPDSSDGNTVLGDGSFSSNPFGMPSGWCIRVFDSKDTIIRNNQIGTTPDGMASGSDTATIGIEVFGDNTGLRIRENTVAGVRSEGLRGFENFFFGAPITITGTGRDLVIRGNPFGMNADDQPVLGSPNGIRITDTFDGAIEGITIGGTSPGHGNEIVDMSAAAIDVGSGMTGVEISGNSIHDTGDLGIDLRPLSGELGVTPNDALDADQGANGLQNFPELSDAVSTPGSGTRVVGALPSEPDAAYRVEIFATPACDASGHGPGQRFLGAFEISTDSNGITSFDQTVPGEAPSGWIATATATDLSTHATSEFSACIDIAQGTACPPDLTGPGGDGVPDGDLTADDFFFYLGLFAQGCP